MIDTADPQVFAAILRTDLTAFVEKVFHTIAPGDDYIHNWHIEAITHELQRCRDGGTTRLLITQPPRSLKSICTSIAFVAWALGHDPSLRFICVSYSQDLARDLATQFRRVVTSDWYRALFPNMRLKRDSDTECVTTRGGGRIATSIGGTLTGRGADIIIIDDPLKAEDAQSDATRRRVLEWYTGALTTRLNDKRTGVIILVMQRLHEDDLAGHLIAIGGWRHLDLPAIALCDEHIEIAPGTFHNRREGEPLQLEREPLHVLHKIRHDLGPRTFSAQYQQRPIPLEGNLIKRDWFGTYDHAPTEAPFQVIQSWDIATSTRDTADYSVCVTVLVKQGTYYVLDVWRGRKAYPELKKFVVTHAKRFDANTVLIEKAGPGEHLLQEYRRSPTPGFPKPIGIAPEAHKAVRMEAASAVVERGDVCLPTSAPWLEEFLHELLAFPNGRHDDQVDAFSQVINWREKKPHVHQPPGPPIEGAYGMVFSRTSDPRLEL